MRRFLIFLVVVTLIAAAAGYFFSSPAESSILPLTTAEKIELLPDLYLKEAAQKLETAGSYNFASRWTMHDEQEKLIYLLETNGSWATNGDVVIEETETIPDESKSHYGLAISNGKMMHADFNKDNKETWKWIADDTDVSDREYINYLLFLTKAGHLFDRLGPSLYTAVYKGQEQLNNKEYYTFSVTPEANQQRFLVMEGMSLKDISYEFMVSPEDNILSAVRINATYSSDIGPLKSKAIIYYSNPGVKVVIPSVEGE